MSDRRTSTVINGQQARQQSVSSPPTQQTVRVAVLPPRLPPDMAPPTGIGMSEAISWDERINWRHNEPVYSPEVQEEPRKRKSFMRAMGITTQRKAAHDDLPPFMFREVSYDTWRKHYAKDAQGLYQGTHAPAEDCLLLPEDVEKWRLGEAKTRADNWTRGKVALPVYNESQEGDAAPEYSKEDDFDKQRSVSMGVGSIGSTGDAISSARSTSVGVGTPSDFTADGKTSAQIIAEAKENAKVKKSKKETWKAGLRNGINNAVLGS